MSLFVFLLDQKLWKCENVSKFVNENKWYQNTSSFNIIVFLFHGATFSLPKEMTKLISKWNTNLILCYIKLRYPRYSHEILVKFWRCMMVLCKFIDILSLRNKYEGQKNYIFIFCMVLWLSCICILLVIFVLIF